MADRSSLAELRANHRRTLAAIEKKLREEDRKTAGIEAAEKHLRQLRDAQDEAQQNGDRPRAEELEKLIRETAAKIAARRDERSEIRERTTELERHEAAQAHRIEQAKHVKLDAVECFDGCAVPRGIQLCLLWARGHGWSGRLSSGDRTAQNCDHCSDKSSQVELWAASPAMGGSGNPANPPCSYCSTCGGTHERQNDGVAYPTQPRGAHGPWWWQGMDATEVDELVAVLATAGVHLRKPYSAEAWHVNVTADPIEAMNKAGIV